MSELDLSCADGLIEQLSPLAAKYEAAGHNPQTIAAAGAWQILRQMEVDEGRKQFAFYVDEDERAFFELAWDRRQGKYPAPGPNYSESRRLEYVQREGVREAMSLAILWTKYPQEYRPSQLRTYCGDMARIVDLPYSRGAGLMFQLWAAAIPKAERFLTDLRWAIFQLSRDRAPGETILAAAKRVNNKAGGQLREDDLLRLTRDMARSIAGGRRGCV